MFLFSFLKEPGARARPPKEKPAEACQKSFCMPWCKTAKRYKRDQLATDLATSPQIEYLVLACEEGGRWGPDQHRLMRSLVRTKVALIHPLLRRRASLAYTRRWWGILSIGAQTVAADCILGRDSPVPAPTTVLPLASVLPLIDVGTEPSRMR